MRILNPDCDIFDRYYAKEVVEQNFPQFVLEVLRPTEKKYYASNAFLSGLYDPHYDCRSHPNLPDWMVDDRSGYESIATLIHSIDIYLRSRRRWDDEPKKNSIVDLLGAYYSGTSGSRPYIELYLHDIVRHARGNVKSVKWLFTTVLLHELAHAALDIRNRERHQYDDDKVSYSSEFGKWREESMANAVALRIIEEYGDAKFYEYARGFMLSQPPEYALGVLMKDFDEDFYAASWKGKILGVNQVLQDEWLQYVKGTPDWNGLKMWSEMLSAICVYELDGKRFTDPWWFVKASVQKALADYEREHGDKMTAEVFHAMFPSKVRSFMAYVPPEEDTETPNKIIVSLKDAEYSLYYFFFEEDVDTFLSNVPFDWVRIKNF